MSTQRNWQVFPLAILAGLLIGGLSVVGDRPGAPRWLTIVANLAFPWALVAFAVGRMTAIPGRGMVAGGIALVTGMGVFYTLTPALYLHGLRDVVWTTVAVIAGPVMGLCGSLVGRRQRAATAALAAPSAVLAAEALWFVVDRRVWHWNLAREAHRFNDLLVLAAMILLGLGLPLWFRTEGTRLRATYAWALAGGLSGAVGFALLYRLILSA